ncbi:N-acetylmuramoyl-L-alanine amidase [Streptomyces nanshensis]|uniref:N-acetylmuramoyl-L-alanine amidase n=1 Tax=Streptomyces nanshensis TaxID=518642 RepID=UPI000A4B29C1
MSNGSPIPPDPNSAEPGAEPPGPDASRTPEQGRRSRLGRRALIALAVLTPTAFAGWLVWQSADQSAGAGSTAPTLMPLPGSSRPASGGLPGGDSGGSGDSGSADGTGDRPLRGTTVVLDPGHNPNNRYHAAEINRAVDIGTAHKECDTTGTATASGYSEAEFTLDLARRVRAGLRARGATVEMTHQGRRPWGPCVDDRAEAGNRADADAVVSLHADGAPASARGFHVILPESVNEGKADTRAVTGPSRDLGRELADAFRESTGSKPAPYAGDGEGTDTRGDLGGLNLTRVPKVFLECGNMRNPRDAAQLTDRTWRARAARGVVDGVAHYLTQKR